MHKADGERALEETSGLREHVTRLNNQLDADSVAVNCLKLAFDSDLQLTLYRHWSLYESLMHTVETAAKFKIWTLKGKQRLSEFLAELGLPLVQVKQKFATMDLGLRNDIGQVQIEVSRSKICKIFLIKYIFFIIPLDNTLISFGELGSYFSLCPRRSAWD